MSLPVILNVNTCISPPRNSANTTKNILSNDVNYMSNTSSNGNCNNPLLAISKCITKVIQRHANDVSESKYRNSDNDNNVIVANSSAMNSVNSLTMTTSQYTPTL
uniref:Uncharacterized protein n=1 Tax=Lygus hesperus TaxID=30085 RepID=A0A0A9X769_LYGHE